MLNLLQDSFVSNLLRIIHTMRPPGKKAAKKGKKKKKDKGKQKDAKDLDAAMEAKVMQYPGVALPDDPNRARKLMVNEDEIKIEEDDEEEEEKEEMGGRGGGGGKTEDARVAEMAMNEVRRRGRCNCGCGLDGKV